MAVEKDKNLHSVTIQSEAPGRGKVFLDGFPVKGVTLVELKVGTNQVSELVLVLNVRAVGTDTEEDSSNG